MQTVDIFIKSYKKDFVWLHHALKSIQKNVTGYNKIILLIPERDKHNFDTRVLPDHTEIHYVSDEGNGYLRQQYYKLTAFNYSQSDYVLFGDSDCFFDHPIDLQEFVADGKPEILYTSWDKVGDAICWKQPTERIMEEPVPFEFMRRNCCIYHRQTLIDLNKWLPNLELIIMRSQHFSEFNLIGAYAYKFEQDKYNFVNTDNWTYVPPKAVQIWSHASKDPGVSETHLREYIRTLETLLQLYGI